MADVESTLIYRALSTGEFPELVARGIEADHFADEDVADVYEFSLEFMQKHKQAPTLTVVRDEFPDFRANLSKDPVSYHMERFLKDVKERKAIELVRAYHDTLEDPDSIDDIEIHALEMARELTEVIPAPRASRLSDGQRRLDEYNRRKDNKILHGILMGIPEFDAVNLGVQPHELVVVVGFQGMGKTTLLQHIALSAYFQNKNVLFISLEVEAEQILRRFDAMLTHVRYQALKALELDVGEKRTWEKMLEKLEEDKLQRDIIIRDDIKNCTVEKVQAETIRYKPDIVLVDYLELMSTPRAQHSSHWEAVAQSGLGLKQNARVMKIPCITAAQLNREGGKGEVTLTTITYQSIGKHSDQLIGLSADDELAARNQMKLIKLKDRDGPSRRDVIMRWNLEIMDVGELGVAERFPNREFKSLSKKDRIREHRLEIALNVRDKPNPFKVSSNGHKTINPWTGKAYGRANDGPKRSPLQAHRAA